MPSAWLSLGANIGDPPAQIEAALELLDEHAEITVTARSSTIVTPAWGNTAQPDFHNLAVAVETSLVPEALLEACLEVEADLGRVRDVRWGPRVIDIDVIAYERVEMVGKTLTLPHPHAHEREFVLVPLREIAPEVVAWIVDRNQAR
jgi:2-amino-4-hydroxy-6-hydroxymethyldihydropteridine diphosphokinase